MDLMLPLFVPYGDCSLSQENVRDELKGQFGDNFLAGLKRLIHKYRLFSICTFETTFPLQYS